MSSQRKRQVNNENIDPAPRPKRKVNGQIDFKLLAGFQRNLPRKKDKSINQNESIGETIITTNVITESDDKVNDSFDEDEHMDLNESRGCLIKLPKFIGSGDEVDEAPSINISDKKPKVKKNGKLTTCNVIPETSDISECQNDGNENINPINDTFKRSNSSSRDRKIVFKKIKDVRSRSRSRSPPKRLFQDDERTTCLVSISKMKKDGYCIDTYHSDHIPRFKIGNTCFPTSLNYVMDKRACFVCKFKIDKGDLSTIKKCSNCEFMCHQQCLEDMRFGNYIGLFATTNNKVVCPRHHCVKCFADRLHTRAFQCPSKLVQCRLCISRYHPDCIPAGCVISNNNDIICPRHFYTKEFPRRQNSYCFECHKTDKGLTKCTDCCRSFHQDCNRSVSYIPNSMLGERCSWCSDHNFVIVGDRIYAAFGSFGHHPGTVVPNDKFPGKKNKIRPGEFVVQWIQGNTYSIINHFNVYLCTEDIMFYKSPSLKSLEGHKQWYDYVVENEHRLPKALDDNHLRRRNGSIKIINKCQLSIDAKLIWPTTKMKEFCNKEVCICPPGMENRCNNRSCENRAMNIECAPSCSTIQGGCSNRIDANLFKNVVVRATEDRGFGLFCAIPIQKDSYIGEYCGEIITAEEKEDRVLKDKLWGSRDKGFYTFYLGGLYIDADHKGGILRYANHSCDPNTLMKLFYDNNGYPHICMYAVKNIGVGEEITFNYSGINITKKKSQETKAKDGIAYRCYCDSSNCNKEFTV